jgi:hypothetical protein
LIIYLHKIMHLTENYTCFYVCDKCARASNHVLISVTEDRAAGRAIIICVIDNLVKGASAAAIQNMNVQFGWPETTGLDIIQVYLLALASNAATSSGQPAQITAGSQLHVFASGGYPSQDTKYSRAPCPRPFSPRLTRTSNIRSTTKSSSSSSFALISATTSSCLILLLASRHHHRLRQLEFASLRIGSETLAAVYHPSRDHLPFATAAGTRMNIHVSCLRRELLHLRNAAFAVRDVPANHEHTHCDDH